MIGIIRLRVTAKLIMPTVSAWREHNQTFKTINSCQGQRRTVILDYGMEIEIRSETIL
jgi:hypothetical protein